MVREWENDEPAALDVNRSFCVLILNKFILLDL